MGCHGKNIILGALRLERHLFIKNFPCLLTEFFIWYGVVQVDLFFYREPEETKPEDEDEAGPQAEYGALPAPEYGMVGGDQWTTAQIPDAAWPGEGQAPISAAPAAASWSDSAGEFLITI